MKKNKVCTWKKKKHKVYEMKKKNEMKSIISSYYRTTRCTTPCPKKVN